MNEVSLFNEKTMTVKEIAQAMGVSYSAVYRAVEKHFPEKMKNGKQTFLNESEVVIISKELKGDYHTSQMTFSAGEKVKNAVTQKTATTKELAQMLGVDVKTIQRASEKLFDKNVVKSISTAKGLLWLEKQIVA